MIVYLAYKTQLWRDILSKQIEEIAYESFKA
jgi:hypothetical protein